MNSSIVYVYLGIVMIIVLATTFYVRTIKTKLDTKVDAMFQLVQSLVNEVNLLKSSQLAHSKPKEVIQLDINSSNNKLVVTENQNSAGEDSDDEDSAGEDSDDEDSADEDSAGEDSAGENSDDESYDSLGIENNKDLFKKTVQMTNDSPHQVNMQSELTQQVAQQLAQQVAVQEVSVDLPEVSGDLPEVSGDLPEVSGDLPEKSMDIQEVSVDLPEKSVDIQEVSVDLPEVSVDLQEVDVEIKAVQLESSETEYDNLTVKQLKEMVSKKGGKVTGKKKGELIEFLLS